jgi:stage III sporulation protein AF
MLEIMFDVTRNIVVLLIVFSLLEMFLPRGEFRPFLNMVIGLVLMLTLLGPLWTLLRFTVEPVLPAGEEHRLQLEEGDKRLYRLRQLNQGLTMQRYQELLAEKISELLRAEGLQVVEQALELVDEPGHHAYGQLLAVRVLAMAVDPAAPPVKKVPEIRISLEGKEPFRQQERGEEAWMTGVADRRLASLLAESLGLGEEKIEVRVIKN